MKNSDNFQPIFSQLLNNSGITDQDHRFIAATQVVADLTGYAKADDLIGLRQGELNCLSAEHHEMAERQNNIALETLKLHRYIGIYGPYADSQYHALIWDKQPFFNSERSCIGVLTTVTDLSCSPNKFNLITKLTQSEKSYHNEKEGSLVYSIIDSNDNDLLTSRELQCLYHLLRGKTANEIALLFSISRRTVETHLYSIKVKFKIRTRSQLIETAIDKGYFYKIPKEFL